MRNVLLKRDRGYTYTDVQVTSVGITKPNLDKTRLKVDDSHQVLEFSNIPNRKLSNLLHKRHCLCGAACRASRT
jgi:hypothetical protein